MNGFDKRLDENGHYPLTAKEMTTIQVNIGYKCNLMCVHCHVEASPNRKEMMSVEIMHHILKVLEKNDGITTVDITGGSPELNHYFRYFIFSCIDMGKKVMVRSNLAIYSEPNMEDIPEFLAKNKVKIIGSLPCYTEEGVDRQRGKGTYQRIIRAMKMLNSIGYGKDGTGLELDIMFNPFGPEIAPEQKMLESAYKEKLWEMHGVVFNRLMALSNMPIGRFGNSMSDSEKIKYCAFLEGEEGWNDSKITLTWRCSIIMKSEHKYKYTWPELVVIESLTAIAVTIILIVWALFVDAPLREIANPVISENPSKAPWYFVGLQELLVYFDSWIAGVMLPLIIIASLIMMPYLDNNPNGIGEYNYSQRKFIVTNFVIGFTMWWILMGIGYFLRGKDWQFYLPMDSKEVLKGMDKHLWSPKPLVGYIGIVVYIITGMTLPLVIWRKLYKRLGIVRYLIVMSILLMMYMVPLKILFRLLFHIRYILVTPWFNI